MRGVFAVPAGKPASQRARANRTRSSASSAVPSRNVPGDAPLSWYRPADDIGVLGGDPQDPVTGTADDEGRSDAAEPRRCTGRGGFLPSGSAAKPQPSKAEPSKYLRSSPTMADPR
jgi:hypothetical protein